MAGVVFVIYDRFAPVVQVEGTDSGSSEGRAVASLCNRAVIVLGRLEFVSARSPGSSDPGCRGSSRVRSRRPTHLDQARRSSNLGCGPQRHQYAGSLLLWCAKSIDKRCAHRFSLVTDYAYFCHSRPAPAPVLMRLPTAGRVMKEEPTGASTYGQMK